MLDAEHRPDDIQLQDPAVLSNVLAMVWTKTASATGIGHHALQRSGHGPCRINGIDDVFFPRDVGDDVADGTGQTLELLGRRSQSGLRSSADGHGGTVSSQSMRTGLANAGSATGHQQSPTDEWHGGFDHCISLPDGAYPSWHPRFRALC